MIFMGVEWGEGWKEYAAIAGWQPGNRVSGYLGYYDTPHEALAECLFYTGR